MESVARAGVEGAPVPVLVNRGAGLGGSAALAPEIAREMEETGVPVAVEGVEPRALEAAIVRAARRAPVVAVGGGDGTLVTAAGVLAGGDVALAPVPLGTLNHFARRLGIPTVREAARAIASGRRVRAPVGVMDDRLFLNTATFGVYADVVRRRERLRPVLRKWGAALVASAVALWHLRQIEVEIETGDESLTRRTPLVWVGVGWGSFPLVQEAPERRASPDLEIVVVRPLGRLAVLRLLLRLSIRLRSRDRPVEDPALEVLHARRLLLRADRRIGVTLDGEVLRSGSPVFLAVQDDALPVVAGG